MIDPCNAPTFERIHDLEVMPEIHNSYGTPAVDAKASLAAVEFLQMYLDCLAPQPRVMPNVNGGLVCEWNGVKSHLTLYFHPSGLVTGASGEQVSNNLQESFVIFDKAIFEIEKELGIVRP